MYVNLWHYYCRITSSSDWTFLTQFLLIHTYLWLWRLPLQPQLTAIDKDIPNGAQGNYICVPASVFISLGTVPVVGRLTCPPTLCLWVSLFSECPVGLI